MRWAQICHEGKTYSLDHLHPKTVSYFQPAKGTNPPRGYTVDVIYSLHCFTRGLQGEIPHPDLLVSDSRETRYFDFRRYELSHKLPAIIGGLMTSRCFHTERGNYFTVKVVDESGSALDYEIYFTASKSSKNGVINLYVQSAYTRDFKHRANRPRIDSKPVSFSLILYSALNTGSVLPRK